MADQSFDLPAGFSTAPPQKATSFDLPQGFSTTPPQAAAPSGIRSPNALDTAMSSLPIAGPIYNGAMAVGNALNGPAPGPNERRGVLAPVIRNEQTGALRLGWPQAALDAVSALQLPGDVASGRTPLDPRVSYANQDPQTLDRAATLAAMTAPDAGGLPRVVPQMTAAGRAVPSIVSRDLSRSGIAPNAINAALQDMGQGAVVGDLSPILQSRVGYLAKTPGAAQQQIFDTLRARQQGSASRMDAALAGIVGPEPVPSAITAGIEGRKDAIGQAYENLWASPNNRPVNTQPIIANLNGNVAMMRGPAQKALTQIRGMFNLPQPIASATRQATTTDPRTVFEIRNAIDGMLEDETNPKVIGALTNVRQRIDSALGASVPGLKTVDAYYEEQARQAKGFDLGRSAINGPNTQAPVHPDDLAAAIQQTAMQSSIGPMKFPSQYPAMISQGMISKIYQIVGNNTSNRVALQKIITGEGRWNYDKIQAALGPQKASQLLALFNNEATMAGTEDLAMANSKTARVVAGGEGLEPSSGPGVLRSALNFDLGDASLNLGSKLTGGAFDAARARRNAALADILMSPSVDVTNVPGGFNRNVVFPVAAGVDENVAISNNRRKLQQMLMSY
jgi:hypothetical protein